MARRCQGITNAAKPFKANAQEYQHAAIEKG
jgi:hypothetical protein